MRAVFQSLNIGRITGPMRQASDTVWDDATYPYRVDLDTLVSQTNVAGVDLDEDALRSISESAKRRCNAIVGPAPLRPAVEAALEDDEEMAPDRLLTGLDGLNGQALTLVRREQSKLRKNKLKGASTATCALCGRLLPSGLLRLAHIKRRAVCRPEECLDPNNTMLACTLGCDELFERDYIGVEAGSVVASSDKSGWTDAVHAASSQCSTLAWRPTRARRRSSSPGIAATRGWAERGSIGRLSSDRLQPLPALSWLAAPVRHPRRTSAGVRLQPWRVETFTFSTDPELVAKVTDVVGLYLAHLST